MPLARLQTDIESPQFTQEEINLFQQMVNVQSNAEFIRLFQGSGTSQERYSEFLQWYDSQSDGEIIPLEQQPTPVLNSFMLTKAPSKTEGTIKNQFKSKDRKRRCVIL